MLHKFALVVPLLQAFTPHFAFAVCVAVRSLPGLVDYDPMQFSMLHKVVPVVSLLLAFTPRSAVFVCVAVRILPGFVDYDPMQFQCCINLY